MFQVILVLCLVSSIKLWIPKRVLDLKKKIKNWANLRQQRPCRRYCTSFSGVN